MAWIQSQLASSGVPFSCFRLGFCVEFVARLWWLENGPGLLCKMSTVALLGPIFWTPILGPQRMPFLWRKHPQKNHWCGLLHDRHYPWFGILSTDTITISYPDTIALAQAQVLKSGSPVTLMGAASAMVRWRPRLQYQDWWRQPPR